ncbi:MAG: sensor histidine kinase, partial [Exilispira sp.]
ITVSSQNNIFFYSKKIRNKIESFLSSCILEAKDKMIKTEMDIISNIFESFDEPVFIFSNQGECLFSNKIGRKIFIPDKFQDKYKEKHFWEIFINSDINNKIQNVIENKDKILSEVEFGDYLFLMRIIHLSLIDSIFIIFTDISEAKKYFELKKGIFSAITHELKTPLTSINGFLEQIIIEAQDKNLQEILSYSEIAKRNTSRLILLTNDIIELERMHYKRNLNPIKFEIVNLLNEIILLFSEAASKKNIDLVFENKDQRLFFNTDKDLFEQIAINLIDNAIKYTEKGYVKIYINKVENEIQFIVEDTGIGIEAGEITKIFEPFYCVDKSRSRQKGGTGLGLSIVKKAIDNLGGSIDVISSPYKGSKFIVTLRENI